MAIFEAEKEFRPVKMLKISGNSFQMKPVSGLMYKLEVILSVYGVKGGFKTVTASLTVVTGVIEGASQVGFGI